MTKEEHNARMREYRKRPGTKEKRRALGRKWRAANPDRVKELAHESHLRRKARFGSLLVEQRKEFDRKKNLGRYGLTPALFESMCQAQDGRCAICDKKAKLFVDHDHDTGAVRALLCTRCNVGIGMLADDPVVLELAAAYLRKHGR
jgi:hypothetical protein